MRKEIGSKFEREENLENKKERIKLRRNTSAALITKATRKHVGKSSFCLEFVEEPADPSAQTGKHDDGNIR